MVAKEKKATRLRVCDYCARNSARWFCAADDAFLCQSCDVSVHTANNMARRHQRVGLKSAKSSENCVPVWHRSIIRKARSPRQKRIIRENMVSTKNPLHLVPESSNEEKSFDEHVLYHVPTLDSLVDDSLNGHEIEKSIFDEFMVSEVDFTEFGVEMQSLLGNEKFGMKEIGILECNVPSHQQLVDDLEHCNIKMEPNPSTIFLNLNFERVLSEWDDDKSPWVTGKRPDFNSGNCWRMDCTGFCGKIHEYEPIGIMTRHPTTAPVDVQREARVSRYRDKRRMRMFSKKIRYAVRKVNAENRPRIKGRFVKRGELVA